MERQRGSSIVSPNRAPCFCRALAIAEKNPEGPEAIQALKMALETSAGPKPGVWLETRAKAIKLIQDYSRRQSVDQGTCSAC